MIPTDWLALAIGTWLGIGFAIRIRRNRLMANMTGANDGEYESGERPVNPMPNYSRGWTTKQREDHRIEAESARWQLDRQQDEILRMYEVCAKDADRIAELERKVAAMEAGERMRREAEEAAETEATQTVPAKEGEAA